MKDIEQAYRNRLAQLEESHKGLRKKRKRLGIFRTLSFFGAVLIFFALLQMNGAIAYTSGAFLLVLFLIATGVDNRNNRKIKFTEQLIRINEEELLALGDDFSPFPDGAEFKNPEHPYTGDLDIFGKFSIYQMLNRTTTQRSAERLAAWLKAPAGKDEILARQQASGELGEAVEWRQHFQALGKNEKIKTGDFEKILDWAGRSVSDQAVKKWNRITSVVLGITVILVILASQGKVTWDLLWISLILHLWVIWKVGKEMDSYYEKLSSTIGALTALEKRLDLILKRSFKEDRLRTLQAKLTSPEGEDNASSAIHRLQKIMGRLDIRNNPLVHFPLNLISFWDWHQFRSLAHLHKKINTEIPVWAEVFIEMETLCSLANLAYNHPDWCFPVIEDRFFCLTSVHLGHPLIPSGKRVYNDLDFSGKSRMMIVTGSNMAGKSTFLRTIGVNTVLACAGAPVCASEMSVSPVRVISSMRIADNLEENISTFYAELRKLEYIIKEARKKGPNLLLMDEILRGTNSNDRHTGSRALIRQLLEVEAVGILATHDLALTDMEQQYPERISNFHFDVQVKGEDLFFDYKLKQGVCRSMNASLLMKKIGIDI